MHCTNCSKPGYQSFNSEYDVCYNDVFGNQQNIKKTSWCKQAHTKNTGFFPDKDTSVLKLKGWATFRLFWFNFGMQMKNRSSFSLGRFYVKGYAFLLFIIVLCTLQSNIYHEHCKTCTVAESTKQLSIHAVF